MKALITCLALALGGTAIAAAAYDPVSSVRSYKQKLISAVAMRQNLSEDMIPAFYTAREEVRQLKFEIESHYPDLPEAGVTWLRRFFVETAAQYDELFAPLFPPLLTPPVVPVSGGTGSETRATSGGGGGGATFHKRIDAAQPLDLTAMLDTYLLRDASGRTLKINPTVYASLFVADQPHAREIPTGKPEPSDVVEGIKKAIATLQKGSPEAAKTIAAQLTLAELDLLKSAAAFEDPEKKADIDALFKAERDMRTRLFADYAAKLKGDALPGNFPSFDHNFAASRAAASLAAKGSIGKALLPEVLNSAEVEIIAAEENLTVKLPVDKNAPAQIDRGNLKVGTRSIDLGAIKEIRPMLSK